MKPKKRLVLVLKIGVSLLILFLLYRKCDWPTLLATLRASNWLYVAAGCLAAFAAYLVAAWRWKVLCPKAGFGALLSMIYISRLYSTILPGQLFGEASKIVYIAKPRKGADAVSYEEGAAGVIVDKIIGLLALLFLGIGAFALSAFCTASLTIGFLALAALLLLVVLLPAVPAVYRLIQALCDKLSVRHARLGKLMDKLSATLQYWRLYLQKPLVLLVSFVLGVIFQLLSVLSIMLMGNAVGIYVAYLDWCWIIAVLSLALLLPISFAGLGVREATLVGLLALCGVAGDVALGCSILVLGLQLLEALAGAVILGFSRIGAGKSDDRLA